MLKVDTTDLFQPGASILEEPANGNCWGGCCSNPIYATNGGCKSGCCNGDPMET